MSCAHGHDVDGRVPNRNLLNMLAPTGAVVVLVAYCDGTVAISSDDAILPDAAVAGVLRNAADEAAAEATR